MFDDIKDKNLKEENSFPKPPVGGEGGSAPQTAPHPPVTPKTEAGKIEDIFATTDSRGEVAPKPEKPKVFQPKTVTTPPEENIIKEESKEQGNIFNNHKQYIKIGGIGLAVIVVLAGGWYGYNSFFVKNTPSEIFNNDEEIIVDEENENINDNDNVINNEVNLPSTENNIEEPPQDEPIQVLDSDQDGLTDAEEKELGMDINNVDTDDDGLFDREEVKVYKTNPLNADTDGDGYLDGAEVNNGYNPKGAGLLYEIN